MGYAIALAIVLIIALLMLRRFDRTKRQDLPALRTPHTEQPAARTIAVPKLEIKYVERQTPDEINIAWPSKKRIYGDIEEQVEMPAKAYRAFNIQYTDEDGVITERDIYPIRVQSFENGRKVIHAWCYLRSEMRTFKNWSIDATVNLHTGKRIEDLGRYLRR